MNYEERPRKVHLFKDQKGAVIPHTKGRLFANTLCKMNSDVPHTHITEDWNQVTCQLCLTAMGKLPNGKKNREIAVLKEQLNECATDCNKQAETIEQQAARIDQLKRTLRFALEHMQEAEHVVIHVETQLTAGQLIRGILRGVD